MPSSKVTSGSPASGVVRSSPDAGSTSSVASAVMGEGVASRNPSDLRSQLEHSDAILRKTESITVESFRPGMASVPQHAGPAYAAVVYLKPPLRFDATLYGLESAFASLFPCSSRVLSIAASGSPLLPFISVMKRCYVVSSCSSAAGNDFCSNERTSPNLRGMGLPFALCGPLSDQATSQTLRNSPAVIFKNEFLNWQQPAEPQHAALPPWSATFASASQICVEGVKQRYNLGIVTASNSMLLVLHSRQALLVECGCCSFSCWGYKQQRWLHTLHGCRHHCVSNNHN